MTTIPTAVVERRSEKQAVEIRLRVSGYPDIGVGVVSDRRAARARDEHHLACEAMSVARLHRASRNRLIRALRAEDPVRWTYLELAVTVGCSPELVAAVVKHRSPRGATPGCGA